MRALVLCGLVVGASALMSACKSEPKPEKQLEKGQVIATVNGTDVTVYELGAEMQGIEAPEGTAHKKMEQAALARLIDRKILADIARDRKLDKTPDYLLQTRRANEQILVSLLQQDEAGKVPSASTEDVEKFIGENPWMFAQRKLLILDQVQFPMPANRKALDAYKPLKTLDQVEQKLGADGIEYRRVPTSLDTLQMPASLTKSIMDLPQGEVFVVPAAGGLTANRIVDIRATPLTGQDAIKVGRDLLRRQSLAQKATTDLEPLVKDARAKVVYQSGYGPPAAPKTNAGTK